MEFRLVDKEPKYLKVLLEKNSTARGNPTRDVLFGSNDVTTEPSGPTSCIVYEIKINVSYRKNIII